MSARLTFTCVPFHPINILFQSPRFIALHEIIWPRDVTEFVYRYNGTARAHIVISFLLQSSTPRRDRQSEIDEIRSKMQAKDMSGQDISDNELAKSHVRYLVGGRTFVPHERVISFGIGSFLSPIIPFVYPEDLLTPSQFFLGRVS